MLCSGEASLLRRSCICLLQASILWLVIRCRQLFREDVLQYDASIIPYCVVLGVLAQKVRGELESGVGEVSGLDLSSASAGLSYIAIRVDAHLLSHFLLKTLVLLDLLALLCFRLLTLVQCSARDAGNSVLRCSKSALTSPLSFLSTFPCNNCHLHSRLPSRVVVEQWQSR